MTGYAAELREMDGASASTVAAVLETLDEPVVFRGLVSDWPAVEAARRSGEEAIELVGRFAGPHPVTVFRGAADAEGRIFYDDELQSVNFEQSREPFAEVAGSLRDAASEAEPPVVYMGSAAMDHFFPGFSDENSLPLPGANLTKRLWIGNRSVVAPHYDAMENIACVCAGRRRFTVFPPGQIGNLYVGPIDFTPAGQSISLVDIRDPDLETFPRFADAMKTAQTALLEPGDAIYIPAMWWHHVESQDEFNILVNHWWQDVPDYVGAPQDVLLHAILNLRELPKAQRDAWRGVLDHYVFDAPDEATSHIPEQRRGVAGALSPDMARQLRALLRNNLNR